jgi:hypothetical protein
MSVQLHEVEAWGTIFSVGSTADYSTATFTALAEVVDGEPPMAKWKAVPTSHLGTALKAATFQPGSYEGGEMKLKLRFASATYTTLDALQGVLKSFKITFTDGTTTPSNLAFNGFLMELGTKVGTFEDLVTVEATFKASGKVVYTPAV